MCRSGWLRWGWTDAWLVLVAVADRPAARALPRNKGAAVGVLVEIAVPIWCGMSDSGYCNCADCKADVLKRIRKVRTGRLKGEPAPERPDMGDSFWDRVHATSAVRDAVRKQRR